MSLINEVKSLQRGIVSLEDKKALQGLIDALEWASITHDYKAYLNIKAQLHPIKEPAYKRFAKRFVKDQSRKLIWCKRKERFLILTRGIKEYVRVFGEHQVNFNKYDYLKICDEYTISIPRGRMKSMKFGQHIINTIQYVDDLEHLKDYCESNQELEALTDAQLRSKYLVNELCKYEGINPMYEFLPHDEMWQTHARVTVKGYLQGIQIEPQKQRELQI